LLLRLFVWEQRNPIDFYIALKLLTFRADENTTNAIKNSV